MDCSLPSSNVHGILPARALEWVAFPFSRGSSQPRDQTQVSCMADRFFSIWATREVPSGSLRNLGDKRVGFQYGDSFQKCGWEGRKRGHLILSLPGPGYATRGLRDQIWALFLGGPGETFRRGEGLLPQASVGLQSPLPDLRLGFFLLASPHPSVFAFPGLPHSPLMPEGLTLKHLRIFQKSPENNVLKTPVLITKY